jgi:polyphosphate kinase 2 (PPK2 family)
VLVERVEGLAREPEWRRAYDEIVAFERSLCDEGTVLLKFWMHVPEAEQLRRFRARERDPLKRWKLTDEDWRNLSRRPAYEQAVADMLRHTERPPAPWHLVGGREQALHAGGGGGNRERRDRAGAAGGWPGAARRGVEPLTPAPRAANA